METPSTQHYLINMSDGRVILYTKQAAKQINYHPISRAVAMAVGNGSLNWRDVVSRIKANLINNQDAWDDLLKKKTTMNMRKSTLTPEDTEGQETAPAPEDVGEEFNMPVDGAGEGAAPAGEGGGAPTKPKGNGRGRNSKKDQPPADNGEPADAGEGAAPAGEGAAPGDGEDLGL